MTPSIVDGRDVAVDFGKRQGDLPRLEPDRLLAALDPHRLRRKGPRLRVPLPQPSERHVLAVGESHSPLAEYPAEDRIDVLGVIAEIEQRLELGR